jgi:hypothetical protein
MSQPAVVTAMMIPLPGGRFARVPISVLEQYVDPAVRVAHGGGDIIEVGEVEAQEMSVNKQTGEQYWHTDWELGTCTYNDDSGFPRTGYCWHRHPLGNSYTEIMQ